MAGANAFRSEFFKVDQLMIFQIRVSKTCRRENFVECVEKKKTDRSPSKEMISRGALLSCESVEKINKAKNETIAQINIMRMIDYARVRKIIDRFVVSLSSLNDKCQ